MFEQILLSRRSIRKFKDIALPKDIVKKIMAAVYFSPSSRGIRPYKVILADDRELLHLLSKSKHGAQLLKTAALGVVIAGDTSQSDVWIEDTSAVAVNVLNICEARGLGACWVQIRNRQFNETISADNYVKGIIGIPKNYSVECIIGIGYPDEIKESYTMDMLDETFFYHNKFGTPFNSNT